MGPKFERLRGVRPSGNQVNCVITPVEALDEVTEFWNVPPLADVPKS
jgi:hypothetical protein